VIVRELERLLVANGAAPRKTAAITQFLREAGRLPVKGRGRNAAGVSAADVASILIALAGSSKANEADARLQVLKSLRLSGTLSGGQTLLTALTLLIENPEQFGRLEAVRISRTARHATLQFSSHTNLHFGTPGWEPCENRFSVEGVISGGLIRLVASALLEGTEAPDDLDEDVGDSSQPSPGA
jgi:hypothetical protein